MGIEQDRLREAREKHLPWRKWGPYLSERQWGTVREDYSKEGIAWDYFPHDQARSRAYKWGEDGIAGISDDAQRLCFALALWNGKDPILKERLFGLTNAEGNHGEDVKEYYFYLDSTPTHSYMKMLYKYPQKAYPYSDLVTSNKKRGPKDREYELLDTHVFKEDRYFDVFVEYAKAAPEDILIRIRVVNRGPDAAELHLLPHLWFRNFWWLDTSKEKPILWEEPFSRNSVIFARDPELGDRFLYFDNADEVLFTENETNYELIFNHPSPTRYVKDAFHRYFIDGRTKDVNPEQKGTKSALHYAFLLKPGGERVFHLRLSDRPPAAMAEPFLEFDETFSRRQEEADAFYDEMLPPGAGPDPAKVIRQGFAGLLWSKQAYIYEVARWLKEHGADPRSGSGDARNAEWGHMLNQDIISMPDKWEYPWFAAWDLAFHTIGLCNVDPDFSINQLNLVLNHRYMHPNGQIPAYEWNFNDVNPPVHAWATVFNYRFNKERLGNEALPMLKRAFHRLLLNFTWWVNRKDRNGRNVFEGGFLGLDNIGVFDRSRPLPTGGYLEQADGTAWMALFSQNMLEIALELSLYDPAYNDMAAKFYEHFVRIAGSMDRQGNVADKMWDEEDGFFYDVLRLPDGTATRLKVRSMVGLLPLCAATVINEESLAHLEGYEEKLRQFSERNPELFGNISAMLQVGVQNRRMLSILDENKLRRVLHKMLDPQEFLSDYGIRSLSRWHEKFPYTFRVYDEDYRVAYLPGESDSGMFGGNSNWRGPIWMPMNILLIRALLQLYTFYGNGFTVECPTGSGRELTLFQVAQDLVQRLSKIFLRDPKGHRPVYGDSETFQNDPHWQDYLLFYEYFNGDTGAGLGASHQSGWSSLISTLLCLFGKLRAEDLIEEGATGVFRAIKPEPVLPS